MLLTVLSMICSPLYIDHVLYMHVSIQEKPIDVGRIEDNFKTPFFFQ